jgi:hypothetical protein
MLAGHADLSTTQRYMHLSPAAIGWIETLFGCTGEEGESVACVARRAAGSVNPQRMVVAGLIQRRQFTPRC